MVLFLIQKTREVKIIPFLTEKKIALNQIFHLLTTPHIPWYTRIGGNFQKDYLGHQKGNENTF